VRTRLPARLISDSLTIIRLVADEGSPLVGGFE
jgi:hypothetical protein